MQHRITNPITNDRFAGAWLVREYVFDSDGTYKGSIRQRRQLQPTDDGILVIQDCQPDDTLRDHPMSEFAGNWVFLLTKNGQNRFYKGPDVVGSGFMWEDGIMTGKGLWPRFCKSFRSYAVMSNPNRQCTGGQFSHVDHTIATITGIAIPESDAAWPSLELSSNACEIAKSWKGTCSTYAPSGTLLKQQSIERQYSASQHFVEQRESTTVEVQFKTNGSVDGHTNGVQFYGLHQRYGTRLEINTWGEKAISRSEILDPDSQQLFIINSIYHTQQLESVEILRLHAN